MVPGSFSSVITALAGGVGAARMLRGIVAVANSEPGSPDTVTAIVNVGDDALVHGLYVCPDLDTVSYTLSGRSADERGWGLADESWVVMGALESLGGETWLRLGDKDLATHLYRTGRLGAGATLSQVTRELAGAMGVPATLIPTSDDPVRTMLRLTDGREVDFQEYFVKLRHEVGVSSVRFAGADEATPAPGALEAIRDARAVIICPSNPIVSIGPHLAVRGFADELRARRSDTVAVSPIVAGGTIKGPADRLMSELGHEPSVVGVARIYHELASTLIIDEADAALSGAVEREGMRCVVMPTVMSSMDRTVGLATRAISEAVSR